VISSYPECKERALLSLRGSVDKARFLSLGIQKSGLRGGILRVTCRNGRLYAGDGRPQNAGYQNLGEEGRARQNSSTFLPLPLDACSPETCVLTYLICSLSSRQ
jgi:hypothetical protein